MPVFKVKITRMREEMCEFLVRMPDKDYLQGNAEDTLAVLDYANEEDEWTDFADDHHINVNETTEKGPVSAHCVFGGTEYEAVEKPKTGPPVDPRQLPLKITP